MAREVLPEALDDHHSLCSDLAAPSGEEAAADLLGDRREDEGHGRPEGRDDFGVQRAAE